MNVFLLLVESGIGRYIVTSGAAATLGIIHWFTGLKSAFPPITISSKSSSFDSAYSAIVLLCCCCWGEDSILEFRQDNWNISTKGIEKYQYFQSLSVTRSLCTSRWHYWFWLAYIVFGARQETNCPAADPTFKMHEGSRNVTLFLWDSILELSFCHHQQTRQFWLVSMWVINRFPPPDLGHHFLRGAACVTIL